MSIKLKDILKENFSVSMLGGVVSNGFHNNVSLSNLVKEKYGNTDEKVDVKKLTIEIQNYNQLGKSIFGESNIKIVKNYFYFNQTKSHTLRKRRLV